MADPAEPPSLHVDAAGATGVAIGDRARVIQHIAAVYNVRAATDAAPRLTGALKGRLSRIFEQHALFAGRESQLAQLDAFVQDRATGCAFVTGGSGVGKTALLANWVRRLEAGPTKVCFHFINRAEGLAGEDLAWRTLCQQLVAVNGLTGMLPPTTDELVALYPQLLSIPPEEGERLVVVLDGLDEALGWTPGPDLFPRPLPDGVFIVFSARAIAEHDWLARAGLQAPEVQQIVLGQMSPTEVSALLRECGGKGTQLAQDPVSVQRLWRVTGGDPFFVRSLVSDLRERPAGFMALLRTLDRPAPSAGLESEALRQYLGRWWEEVSEAVSGPVIEDLLGYLATARGPMRRDELVSVAADDALTGLGIDRALRAVRRYLIGDAENGYALSHPRFQTYVAERIADRLEHYRRALRAYCARWAEHGAPYALRHYAGHLVEAEDWTALERLLAGEESARFAKAREAAEGSATGYVADVNVLWRRLDETGARDTVSVAGQVRCALVATSVRSISQNFPAELLQAMVRAGLWTPETALDHARLMPDLFEQARALAHLVPLLPEAKRPGVIGEAFDALCAIGTNVRRPPIFVFAGPAPPPYGEDRRDELLVLLAPLLSTPLLGPALDIARAVPFDNQRVRALAAVAARLAEPERTRVFDEALGIARKIQARGRLPLFTPGGVRRARALATIADFLTGADRARALAEALDWARNAGTTYHEVRTMVELLAHFDPDQRESVAGEAFALVRSMEASDTFRSIAIRHVLPWAPADEQSALALELAGDADADATDLLTAVPFLPAGQRAATVAKALESAGTLDEEGLRAFRAALEHLGENERREAVHRAMQLLRDTDADDAEALGAAIAHLAPCLPEPLLEEALRMATGIGEVEHRTVAVAGLAPWLPVRLLAEALAASRRVGDALSREGWTSPASTRSQPASRRRVSRRRLEDQADIVRRALAETFPEDRVRELAALLPSLDERERGAAVDGALRSVREIREREARREALVDLARSVRKLPREAAYPVWVGLVHASARGQRDDLVSDLTALLPVVTAVAGRGAVAAVSAAVEDVRRWYP